MAFRFTGSTAVAAGTFSPHVIHPQWLTQIGLLQEGIRVRVVSDFRRPGVRYTSEQSAIEWEVCPDRLMLATKRPTEDCGVALATIIANLPWTPLIGVGINAQFVGEPADIERLPANCHLPECEIPGPYRVQQRDMHVGFSRCSHLFNVQLAARDKIELAINVHTELDGKAMPQDASDLAQATCLNFFALRSEATDLARRLWQLELKYEPNSD